MTRVIKKNKFSFYIQGFTRHLIPVRSLEKKISHLYRGMSADDLIKVERRVEYYNKINSSVEINHHGTAISDLIKPKTPKAYYFDTFEYARYFPKDFLIDFAFGDINTVLDFPMIAKSRPIHENNMNNILLNLDKARHFVSVKDKLNYSDKKNIMIGRAGVYQNHRIKFFEKYFNNPMCDLGQVNKYGGDLKWLKPKISIDKLLRYKFILSIEGNDVATNLKWIMSSNSIAVSPPLKMETWYMEGTLKPNEHFIGVDENYENLELKLQYFLDHESEAREIIQNANEYRSQFNNKNVESLVSILALKKYFDLCR